ncbi:putative ribonuclease H protein [Vitis vinifera]|uniref:Putative ribonuclease H protein n=1 Tax=Vitis vinifera TaxID=29760 RepID=A0A438G262_VITVI|nr:putative ribonuclease H protein [Vitis vinifera]
MTLIKSTLASIPIYLLSLIRIPKVVAKRIEKIQRDFLWGGGSLEGKGHLINWQVVCSPKEEGGLGIRKIDLLNKTLLGKWVWRYAYEKDNLWKKAIGVKYGQEGCGWRTKEVCGPYGVGLWKEIMKEAEWCWESMDLKVGKGNRVLFWMDKWCGNEALSQTFPQLFTLAGHKNAKVCEVWDSSLGQGGWNLSLARDLNDWEIDQIGEMLNILKDFRISQEEDSVRWKREGNGVFGAKGAYRSLSGYSVGAFPNRRIWMDRVPTKVSFFAWEAAWGKILTLDKLQRRGWQLPNRVKTIWEITLVIFGVQWVFPESVIEERNRIVFRGGSLDVQKFKNSFVCNLWGWAKVYIGEETYSLLGFWFQKVSGVFFRPVLGFRSLYLVVLVFMRWSFLPGIVRLFLGCHALAVFRVVGIYSSSSLLLAFGCTSYTLCIGRTWRLFSSSMQSLQFYRSTLNFTGSFCKGGGDEDGWTLNTMFQKMFHQEKRYGNSTQSSRIASQYLLGDPLPLVHWNALLSAGPECFSALELSTPMHHENHLLPPPTQEQQPTGLALQGPNLLHILAPTRRIARN